MHMINVETPVQQTKQKGIFSPTVDFQYSIFLHANSITGFFMLFFVSASSMRNLERLSFDSTTAFD
ncbi:hypothetical protein EYZ11_012786 [Aspergillus tanneri]|uniref:Uncharacterized protein n=1 Tax=Aspergillus tanneri TaxID=1220188 RepID=A0A4S3J1G4_9EURO|nr:hypothetical protein EYZ11_012786 [Aspergillus tanneri]